MKQIIMSSMPDPMNALLDLQKQIDRGMPTQICVLDKNYRMICDQPHGVVRFSYAKIIKGNVQALSIFGHVQPIDGMPCFNVGYAVNAKCRGNGLGVEAVNTGIAEMKKGFGRSFYVEAVIDITNTYSIKVAEKVFSVAGEEIKDHHTGIPSLYFKKLA